MRGGDTDRKGNSGIAAGHILVCASNGDVESAGYGQHLFIAGGINGDGGPTTAPGSTDRGITQASNDGTDIDVFCPGPGSGDDIIAQSTVFGRISP